MITFLINKIRKQTRTKRAKLFRRYMIPHKKDIILDLGSGDVHYISSIIPFRKNIYIADISRKLLEKGKENYGFKRILLPENGCLPFKDKCFDVVHCNSVIEHVTVNKKNVYNYKTWEKFRIVSFKNQQQFSNEIRRISKNYFVQTPNRNFIIESHTLFPFINFLPRSIMMLLIFLLNKFWVKKTTPDWNILSKKELKKLFPEAKIIKEKFLFMTKSLIAIKSNRI